MFPATKRFVVLRDLQVKVADCKDGGMFEDNVMQVKYVYLTKDRQNVENSKQIQAGTSATVRNLPHKKNLTFKFIDIRKMRPRLLAEKVRDVGDGPAVQTKWM